LIFNGRGVGLDVMRALHGDPLFSFNRDVDVPIQFVRFEARRVPLTCPGNGWHRQLVAGVA
jgi:hypothetical protein